MRVCVLVCLSVCLCVIPAVPLDVEYDRQDPGHYLNSFVIKTVDSRQAREVAGQYGFVVKDEFAELDMYLLEHPEVTGRSKRADEDYITRLRADPRVEYAEQQITLKRVKRTHYVVHDRQNEFPIRAMQDRSKVITYPDKFDRRDGQDLQYNDKEFDLEWYLINTGQTGGKRGLDLNVLDAWNSGITGKNVVVTILDDGVDHTHEDLTRNYDAAASKDFNGDDQDPTPDKSVRGNSHGTRCAGEVAAQAGNGICGVGIAYDCKIGGVRILDGPVTDALEAQAILFNNQHIDIYSASWGPHDDGRTMEKPEKACSDALRTGVEKGRGGKGSIFVWASGNGGSNGDTCGADGYVSSIESISVQSLSDQGDMPFFGEKCTSTMVSVPSGGESTIEEEGKAQNKVKVVTTDIDNGCVLNFEGTSSAAPLASGCLALVLQANPDLTWRDVQHIVASGARMSWEDDMWVINGAGYHVNDKFGFGMMDCSRMVELAQDWTNKPPQQSCQTEVTPVNREIPSSGCHKLTFDFSDSCQGDRISNVEHVQLSVKLSHWRRGNIEIFLTSPSGTRSHLLRRRENDDTNEDVEFTFMTVHSWMENPEGTWIIEVCDNPGDNGETEYKGTDSPGNFKSWSLKAFGFYDENAEPSKRSEVPNKSKIRELMDEEFKKSRSINVKRTESLLPSEKSKKEQKQQLNEAAQDVNDLFSKIHGYFSSRSLDSLYQELFSDENEVNSNNRNMDTRNLNNDGPNDKDLEVVSRQILEILNKMDTKEARSYLELYLERKREEERKRKIDLLIRELKEILDKKK